MNQAAQEQSRPVGIVRLFPFLIPILMVGALFVLDAILPLQGIRFNDALLTQLGSWVLFPTHLLFPGHQIVLIVPSRSSLDLPMKGEGWQETSGLLLVFLVILLLYVLALRYLPQRMSRRSLLTSTLLLGLVYVLIPVATSSDV